jgi:hypothetical protein
MTQQNNGWTLDRNLSVGLIVAVLFQAGAFIWYGAKLDSRVIVLEDAGKAVTAGLNEAKEQAAESQKTLEGKIDGIGSRLVRIETILEMNLKRGNEPVKQP